MSPMVVNDFKFRKQSLEGWYRTETLNYRRICRRIWGYSDVRMVGLDVQVVVVVASGNLESFDEVAVNLQQLVDKV